jgi:hypothetical protein
MDSECTKDLNEFLDSHPELRTVLGTYLALMIFEKGIKIFRDLCFSPVKFSEKDVIEK